MLRYQRHLATSVTTFDFSLRTAFKKCRVASTSIENRRCSRHFKPRSKVFGKHLKFFLPSMLVRLAGRLVSTTNTAWQAGFVCQCSKTIVCFPQANTVGQVHVFVAAKLTNTGAWQAKFDVCQTMVVRLASPLDKLLGPHFCTFQDRTLVIFGLHFSTFELILVLFESNFSSKLWEQIPGESSFIFFVVRPGLSGQGLKFG